MNPENQERRIPASVFEPALLVEAPQVIAEPLTRAEVIETFNDVYQRIDRTTRGLEAAGVDFPRLREIAAKEERREYLTLDEVDLIDNYKTLLDGRDLRFGLRNLQTANYIAALDRREAGGARLAVNELEAREDYHNGRFDRFIVAGWLHNSFTEDRFRVPAYDVTNGESFEYSDGVSTDGMLRYLDDEIFNLGLAVSRAGTRGARQRLEQEIDGLRRQRDVLFTSSSPIQFQPNEAHARNQVDAKNNSTDEYKAEGPVLNWLNSEDALEGRRYLNLPIEQPRGRDRIGCLPLLFPLPFLFCCTLPFVAAWQTSPCPDPRVDPHTESFTYPVGQKKSDDAWYGATERKIGQLWAKKSQFDDIKIDDEAMLAGLAEAEKVPGYVETFAHAELVDGLNNRRYEERYYGSDPMSPATELGGKEAYTLRLCNTPEEQDKQARDYLSGKRSYDWDYQMQKIKEMWPRLVITSR